MSRQRDGFVLVSVLWVVALLTIITLSYHHRARLEVQASRYSLDSSQAMLAARGAIERGVVDLRNKAMFDRFSPANGGVGSAPMAFLGQPWARGGELFGKDGLLDPGETFENDSVHYAIEDLERLVNINMAPESLIENIPGIDRPTARQIHFRRTGVDETGSASGGGRVAFQDIAELRSYRGIKDKEWYGAAGAPGLRGLLTTYGDGRVNINTAPGEVLEIVPGVGAQEVQAILVARNGLDGLPGTRDDLGWGDWEAFSKATSVQGSPLQALQRFCKFDSSYFKIRAVATRRGGRIRSACAAIVQLSNETGAATIISWTEESLGTQ